jgi:hypothetical protein
MKGFKGHNLIIGMTGTGKSSLLKYEIIPKFRKVSIKSAVLDPLGDPAFNADFQTKDSNEFLRFAFTHTGYILIIDESGRAVGRYNRPMQALATDIRHKGNFSFFATQGVTQLSNIVRDQCANVFLFLSSRRNVEIIADEWDQPTLLGLPKLSSGQFYFVPRFGEIRAGHLDFSKRRVYYEGAIGHGPEPKEVDADETDD